MNKKYFIVKIISAIFLIFLWYIITYFSFIGPTLLSTPQEVFNTILKCITGEIQSNQNIFIHAKATIFRALKGWWRSIFLGVGIGILVGIFSIIYMFIEMFLEFIRAIPPILAFPLFLVAFNYSEPSYIWTIVFGCLPIMILTVAKGVRGVSRIRLELINLHRVPFFTKIIILFMEIFPSIFLGARITFSFSLIIAVVCEMVFTPRSGIALGSLAKDAEISFDTPVFYAVIIVIGLWGYLINLLLKKIEGKFGFKGESNDL